MTCIFDIYGNLRRLRTSNISYLMIVKDMYSIWFINSCYVVPVVMQCGHMTTEWQ